MLCYQDHGRHSVWSPLAITPRQVSTQASVLRRSALRNCMNCSGGQVQSASPVMQLQVLLNPSLVGGSASVFGLLLQLQQQTVQRIPVHVARSLAWEE